MRPAVHDRHAVVGDGDDAGLAHLADLGELLAGEADRDGADRDRRAPDLRRRRLLEDVAA